jgi:H+/Cl- antiporter ClcA
MRRIGMILLALGIVGFLLATSRRAGYDSVQGALKSTFSSEERSKKDTWETARWLSLGMAVVGVVFVLLPGKKA